MNEAKNKAEVNIYQLLRGRINLKEYCENELGLNFHRSGNSFRATPNTGGKDAFMIKVDNPDFWFNFVGDDKNKQGIGGDVIDLCAIENHNGDKGAALKELAEKFLTETERKEHFTKIDKWINERNAEQAKVEFAQKCFHSGQHEIIKHWPDYLYKRGLNDDDIKRFGLGYDMNEHRLLIPRYDYNGVTVLTHSTRRMPDSNGHEDESPKYKNAINNSFVHKVPLGLQTLERQGVIVLTEGDFDYFMFEKNDYACLGKIEVSENEWRNLIIRFEKHESGCVLAYDTDKTGKDYTEKVAVRLFENGIKFSVVNLPEQFKDVNEFVINGGNLSELIENAVDGFEYLALSFKPSETDSKSKKRELEKGLKDFLIQTKKRGVDDADLQSLYNKLKEAGFPDEWLKAVKKKADGGETEAEIVEALTKKYDFLFNERTGFYVYDKSAGIWQQKDDSFIKNAVKKHLGATASSRKLYAITEHLKAATVSKTPIEKFNKMPLFGFQNKTLHFKGLKSEGLLKDFEISDYLTHRVDYDYDSEAKCDEWKKAVSLIFADDENRVKCFQEFCGYCLINHCKYEKALILRDKGGNGSNGKSTLLKVLKSVFGNENCTCLQPYQFGDKFSIIHLKDSKVNICADCDNDIRDAMANLKLAISGETLNGCFKNKDFVEFEPVAKIIFAINGVFNVKSLINGSFKRRLLLIDCPVQFIDDGEEDLYHVKKDHNIIETLVKEKSGIFNWCVVGAKRLIQNGGNFTQTDEQAELDAMFMTANEADSVNQFVETMLEDDSAWKGQDFKIADVYASYVSFCAEKDIEKFLSKIKFHGIFEARLKAKTVKFKRWRPHGEKEIYTF